MKPFGIVGAGPSVVSCDLRGDRRSVDLIARNERGQFLTRVGFESTRTATPVGFELIKAALIAQLVGEFRSALAIHVNFILDPRSLDFLNRLSTEVVGSLSDSRKSSITANGTKEIEATPRTTVENAVSIGYSGGRDSSTSLHLLEACGFYMRPYTISYDQTDSNAEFGTFQSQAANDAYYEPFDIPATYFAPFWDTDDRVPEFISVGHSFDVLGFPSSHRRAPYESPRSMQIHEAYLQAMLGTGTKFLFPLSSLSTYSVYEWIRRKYGLKNLEKKTSCWNSDSGDCGHCDKCQRVKLAASGLHKKGYVYLPEAPQVVTDHSYLFGNPEYNDLVRKYGIDGFSESQLFSANVPVDERVIHEISRVLGRRQICVEAVPNAEQPKTPMIDLAAASNLIGIDYRSLPSDPLNSSTSKLPYESYFGRETPVTASHGEQPVFNNSGWSFKRVSEGPRLEVPDTPLFRKFFKQE